MLLSSIRENEKNPRFIKTDKFEKLCQSIKEFGAKMMPLRPIVIDDENVILGGNMRYKALLELGYTEVPDDWVVRANDLTSKEKNRFIISDNIGYGQWDFEILANEWENADLLEFGFTEAELSWTDICLPPEEDKKDNQIEDIIITLEMNNETFENYMKQKLDEIKSHGIKINIS